MTHIAKEIVYGTISTWRGKKAEEKQTHQWICYVRGPNNEDISYFIDHVVFVLHPSFEQPERVVSTWPFVIQERGWGQFEIQIRIYVKGSFDTPLVVTHMLKLYSSNSQNTPLNKKPVTFEQQDEIVFVNPSSAIIEQLAKVPEQPFEIEIVLPTEDDNEPDDNVSALQNYKNLRGNFINFEALGRDNKMRLEAALNVINSDLLTKHFKANRTLDQQIQDLEIEYQNLLNQHQQKTTSHSGGQQQQIQSQP